MLQWWFCLSFDLCFSCTYYLCVTWTSCVCLQFSMILMILKARYLFFPVGFLSFQQIDDVQEEDKGIGELSSMHDRLFFKICDTLQGDACYCVNVHVCVAFLLHLSLSYCRYSWTLHGVFLCWNILWACSTCQNNRCTVCFWGKPRKHHCLHHISVEHKLYTNQILYFS